MRQYFSDEVPQMSRYYLHLRNEGEFRGADFPDVEAAKVEAVRSVREIIADEICSGSPVDLRDSIEVADEEGRTVLTVPFSDAVSIRA